MAETRTTNTVVIGAGQAGLAMSRCLQKADVDHAVLERERLGQSWRAQRWESFRLNTPNAFNLLPGDRYDGNEPLGFSSAPSLVSYFEAYAKRHSLPVEEGVRVTRVAIRGGELDVETERGSWRAHNVVLCCGDQNAPRRPPVAASLPDDVAQLHAGEYRSSDRLPDGAVLVVGSAQSGVQIAEDLVEAGRTVYLCTSAVGRMPRRYRGKDVFEWMIMARLGEQRPADLENPADVHAPQPQTSGTHGGHTVSLQQLARDGVRLLGRMTGASGRTLEIGDDLTTNVAHADAVAARTRKMIDGFIESANIDAPPAEPEPGEAPYGGLADMAAVRSVDLDRDPIRSVIWATGFGPDLGFLDPSLLDDRGRPRHEDGVCDVPGLYCLGFVWLRRRVSGLVAGVGGDAEHLVDHILRRNAGAAG